MPNNKWDDEDIENLLRDFPKIHDDRPKEEVHQRLKNQRVTKNRQAKRWLPLVVAALAFITFGILLASILSQENQSEMSRADQAEEQGAITSEQAESEESATEDAAGTGERAEKTAEESAETSLMLEPQSRFSSVYEEDLENHTLFTIGLTESAFVIPVSFLIPDDQIEQDFESEVPHSIDLYNEYAEKIDEEALGFDNYHPYLGTFAASGQRIEHTLPADHQYDMASAAIGVYIASLKETFRDAEEVAVVGEDGSSIEFDQVGPMDPIETSVDNAAYYAFTTSKGDTYITPDYGMEHNTPEEAFNAMAVSTNDFYQPLIPEGISFTVTESDQVIELEFAEPVDLNALEESAAIRMIEGLSFSAKSFGKQVRLRNIVQEQWAGYDLTQVLPVPVAPNRLEWPLN